MSPKPPPPSPVFAPASSPQLQNPFCAVVTQQPLSVVAPASPPQQEQQRTAPPVAETKGGRGRGKGEPIDTEYSSDSESGLDTDDSIRKKRCALPKNKKKKRSKSKKAPKKKGKKYNVEIEVINLDNDKEEYPVFDDMIADGIREWEVIKIHPIKGTSYVYNNIYNIGIDWSQVNSVCFYMRLCVHRQPLTYFIPYLLLLDR